MLLWLADKETEEDFVQEKEQPVCKVLRPLALPEAQYLPPAAIRPQARLRAHHLLLFGTSNMGGPRPDGHLGHLDSTVPQLSTVTLQARVKQDAVVLFSYAEVISAAVTPTV